MTENERSSIILQIKSLEEQLIKLESGEIKATECEVWARSVGFYAIKKNMNPGKQEEVSERVGFDIEDKK